MPVLIDAKMKDLISLFDLLNIPSVQSASKALFTALPIESNSNYRVAKDPDGAPAILISISGEYNNNRPHPISIEHLIVQHDVECRISQPDSKTEDGRFTLIRCIGVDRSLHVYFLRVVNSLMVMLGSSPSQQEVTSSVNKLVELFRVMAEPSRKSIQGLWAELLVIVRSQDSAILVDAWHTLPSDLYDFSMNNQRIEVKSVIGRVRQHHFSLQQVSPPHDTNVLVASILVERAGGGLSITDLADKVRSRLLNKPDLLFKIDHVIGLSLGENWRAAIEDRFDWELGIESLSFFDISTIPAFRTGTPPGVTNVTFVSNLSQTPSINISTYSENGYLFKALLG